MSRVQVYYSSYSSISKVNYRKAMFIHVHFSANEIRISSTL
jgi:hypothetical protein